MTSDGQASNVAVMGIRLVQLGEPLGHGTQGLFHCRSSDRLVGAAVSSVAEGKDEEHPNLGVSVFAGECSVSESHVEAELDPGLEVATAGSACLGSGAVGCNFESSSEVSVEATADLRWS